MTPPLSSKPGTELAARGTERRETGADTRQQPTAPGPFASFVRFVGCGGGVGLACGPAVTALALLMPWVVANAVITVVSTLLCTELHARFTFGTGQRAGRRQHWQSAGSATAAYAMTCAAMLVLHAVQPSPGVMWQQVVYLGASGLAGIGRFLVLRLFVFADRGYAGGRRTMTGRSRGAVVPALSYAGSPVGRATSPSPVSTTAPAPAGSWRVLPAGI
ncbi:GtrA family protein [Streptomyces sp. CA-249302]|uniref:GtrA family protein n=1 Tax=Streptomyces sp. CA-249302 TaxID=3240058 RepID=UPI003D912715